MFLCKKSHVAICLYSLLLVLSASTSGESLLNSVSNASVMEERASLAPSVVPEIELDDGVKKASYGADISWPMQHERASTNFPWLPHNVDPENNPIPDEYIGMPLQPLGDRQKAFEGKVYSFCNLKFRGK